MVLRGFPEYLLFVDKKEYFCPMSVDRASGKI